MILPAGEQTGGVLAAADNAPLSDSPTKILAARLSVLNEADILGQMAAPTGDSVIR